MLNRRKEAADALKFANAMDDALNDQGTSGTGKRLLNELKTAREEKNLAVIPTSALECRQLYADLLAEHMVREYFERGGMNAEAFPSDEEIKAMGSAQAKNFRLLFQTGEARQYGRGVYDTHMATRKFFAAAAAYAGLRPGGKGKADAEPEEESLRQAMVKQDAKSVDLTFDVFSNQISPMERFARAMSRLAPEGALNESGAPERLRVPKQLLEEAEADEVAAVTLLYYRHREQFENVKKWTDFYPMPQNETGVYISDRDQTKAVEKLLGRGDEEEGEEQSSARRKLRWMRLREVYIPGSAPQSRRIMAALRQECVDMFINCMGPEANKADYYEIVDDKPRAVLDALNDWNRKDRDTQDALKEYIVTEFTDPELEVWVAARGSAALEMLRDKLESDCDQEVFKGCKGKDAAMFRNLKGYWALKLCFAAHWFEQQSEEEVKDLSKAALLKVLEGEAPEVFRRLESAKRRVFGSGLERVQRALGSGQRIADVRALAESFCLAPIAAALGGDGDEKTRIEDARALAAAGSGTKMKFDRAQTDTGEFRFSYRIYAAKKEKSACKPREGIQNGGKRRTRISSTDEK